MNIPRAPALERVFSLFVLLITLVALLFVAVWSIVLLGWPSGAALVLTKSIPLNNSETLQVDYPAVILADSKPRTLTFTRPPSITATDTLTITVAVSQLLRFISPNSQLAPLATSITFPASTTESQMSSVAIVNAQKATCNPFSFRADDIFRIMLIKATFRCISTPQAIVISPAIGTEQKLGLEVETTFAAALRDFVNNEKSDKSPLIFLAAALFSAVVWSYTQIQNLRDKNKKLAEEKSDKDKQLAETQLEDFRTYLRKREAIKASETFEKLKQLASEEHVSQTDLQRMQQLMDITHGKLNNEILEQLLPTWGEETAHSILYAKSQGKIDAISLLNYIRRLYGHAPAELIETAMAKARVEMQVDPIQSRSWPTRPNPIRQEELFLPDTIGNRLRNANPFPNPTAEEEESLLFSSTGSFWNDHPLQQQMQTGIRPKGVWGLEGTGRTALALGLGKYTAEKEVLVCYLRGLPQLPEIQAEFAKRILEFVCIHPTWLSPLGQDERSLIAQFCATYLGKEIALAEIGFLSSQQMKWLDTARDLAQRKLWESEVSIQLRLLKEQIQVPLSDRALFHSQWIQALKQCAHSLGFGKGVWLVLDVEGFGWIEWFTKSLLPNLQQWTAADIVIRIFVPEDPTPSLSMPLKKSLDGQITFEELHWRKTETRDDFEKMIHWRFERFCNAFGIHTQLDDLFQGDAFQKMIQAADYNPGCFIRLWNAIAQSNPLNGRITENVLREAENKVKCR
ncbi:MAG: hypothetical protein HY868_16550 [Chloroflexi bacterium]|nr:hypothetical protein [Chloroflexota bacterium]